jgi:DNA-directed RNA polymerase sigma subunit (sigma70/sigma32)
MERVPSMGWVYNTMASRMRQLKITKSITNRESQSLDKYLQEIGKEGLITADMEVELARKIKEGDGQPWRNW